MATAWMKFREDVTRAREDLGFGEGEECFYRGQGDVAWELLPTLLRHCKRKSITTPEAIRDLEASLYFEFRARAKDLHSQISTEWDILFSMRHHGLATRLLDWTGTLGVAIFFALRERNRSSTPCVWLLNPYALNELSWEVRDLVAPEYLIEDDYEFSDYLVDYSDESGFEWKEPVALYPLQRNARQHAQRGYFTIHGESQVPLERIKSGKFTRKVPLPEEAWNEAEAFLEDAGIDEFLMFPDLDGLARHLHRTHAIGE
jgi:hypothetical protein